ncbi:MAG TPA: penicillin acylase family protein, partial [Chitinophagaceae bacterium]|nr:penicillin acylase family protein [Chitinophagaceae bacterium]
KKIVLHFQAGNNIQTRTIKTLYTHHGPVMAKRNGRFLSMRADNRIMNGLIQCWQRTKAKNLEEFKRTLALNGNISNNTVYADDAGNIAYWHGNRVPARDPKYDWSKPVDGTTRATEWKGLHPINETIQMINPRNGWLQNCNSTPFTAADTNSPKKSDYPSYMAPDEENFRGLNAVRVLREQSSYNLEKVIRAGYDPRLTAFETLIPALINAFESHKSFHDSLYSSLAEPLNILRNWDYRVGEKSIATTLAIEWGQKILPMINNTKLLNNIKGGLVEKTRQFLSVVPADSLLLPLLTTIRDLESRFGNWQVAWGEINRFQRISNDIEFKFDDTETSIPVGFVSSTWGMLPSFSSQTFPNTKKRYGIYGNSFICAVEFGKKIKAKSLLAGGESGMPGSKHFFDQGLIYSKGQFRDVLFYKEDILKHAERVYRPGE